MEYVRYIFRFLYRIRWWLILGTTIITLLVIYLTWNMRGAYQVQATLYTGVVSGYSIEDNGNRIDWGATQNAMDNLINIIKAESTLKRVSIRLFSRILVEGNPDHDTNRITAASYRYTFDHIKNSPYGKELIPLIDRKSEDKTVENFLKYEKPEHSNYIYGLFYYNHPFYSYNALKNITVVRKGSSDLLELGYSSSDPGVAFNTMEILTKEFVNEYNAIRYGETDKVIEYFKKQLTEIGNSLKQSEDDLTQYNVKMRVINYLDETKEIAAINKEFELREQDVLFAYNSSKAMIEALEKRMDENSKQIINNIALINKLKEAAVLTGRITEIETISTNNQRDKGVNSLQHYKDKLTSTRKDLSEISSKYVAQQHTKEGVAKSSIIEQWLDQTLLFEKAKAELDIVRQSRQDLDDKYAFFAPVGSTIKQKERLIDFTERNYLSVLRSYNDALMRKKNLEMTSASLKVLNMPAYPINAEPTAKKKLVMAACVGSFLFILGFMFIIEILDRTLRDPIRTYKLTECCVLGAFPSFSRKRGEIYNKEWNDISVKYLSNSILRFFTRSKKRSENPYIVNFLILNSYSEKNELSSKVENYWKSIGLKVKKITGNTDFDMNNSTYLLTQNINDIYPLTRKEEILIIEYPKVDENTIPTTLLEEAQLNLLVVSAEYGWKDKDKVLIEKFKAQIKGKVPFYIYLTNAKENVVQAYTGMLPPYTFVRQLLYRLSQLAITEKTKWKIYRKNSSKARKDQDDD